MAAANTNISMNMLSLRGKTIRTVGDFPDAHHRDQGRIFLHSDELVADWEG